MLTESMKNEMAKANGLTNERYVELVRKSVDGEFQLPDEVAILRKICSRLLDIVVELHSGELSDEVIEEFLSYNSRIEAIKKARKEELGIADQYIII